MSLGILAGATAIVRARYVEQLQEEDLSYEAYNSVIWSAAESAMTIVATSIPILRVFFKQRIREVITSYQNSSSRSKSRTNASGSNPSQPSQNASAIARENKQRSKRNTIHTMEHTSTDSLFVDLESGSKEGHIELDDLVVDEKTGRVTALTPETTDATLFTLATYAFPANLLNNDLSAEALAEITEIAAKITREAETKRQLGASILPPGFDADAQRISTTGKWRYIPPGPDDIRGPCPGLNVMANHGYLPRNGIASVVQMTLASNEVFGMGLDLSAFLSVYASVMGGNITAASIGGKPKRQEGLLGLVGGLVTGLDLLGEPQGLSATHNRFEADCSPTRADLYKTGDPVSLNVPQFEQLYAMPLGPNGYDLTVMHPFRGKRFKDSVAT
ncbi:Peroxidase-2 domain containing protein, partial [Pyrenophora tritici-repentis]